MAITITLDEETSAQVADLPLAEITLYAQEGIRQRLQSEGDESDATTEIVPADEPWDAETIIAVRESWREVQETGITYSLNEVRESIMAKIDAWEKANPTK